MIYISYLYIALKETFKKNDLTQIQNVYTAVIFL